MGAAVGAAVGAAEGSGGWDLHGEKIALVGVVVVVVVRDGLSLLLQSFIGKVLYR